MGIYPSCTFISKFPNEPFMHMGCYRNSIAVTTENLEKSTNNIYGDKQENVEKKMEKIFFSICYDV